MCSLAEAKSRFRFRVFTDQHYSIATGHLILTPILGLGGDKRHVSTIKRHLSKLGTRSMFLVAFTPRMTQVTVVCENVTLVVMHEN